MKIVDLTVEIHDGFQSHPSHARTVVLDYVTHAFSAPRYLPPCKGFASKLLIISDHVGTHVDAPFHFFADMGTVESTRPEQLIGEAVAIDATDHVGDAGVTDEVLQRIVSAQDLDIKAGDIVLVRTWKGPWGGDGFHEAKGLALSGAKWLLEKGVKVLGTDTSILERDNHDMGRPVHLYVLGKGIPIIENLVNLEKIDRKRFFFVGLPLKIRGATGSPIRAVAITEFWKY
jgi:Predicted metal-dependent hydrolase